MVPHCKAGPVLTTRADAGGNSRAERRSILRAYGGDENGSSQLVERLDGTVSGGLRCRSIGTEAREKRAGVFVCAGCSLPLFTSAMKFDSGTGWPSFFTSIPGVFATTTDRKLFMERTEYHCVRCGGHHGHIFDDGPDPTGLRYCNNGVALRFIPKEPAQKPA